MSTTSMAFSSVAAETPSRIPTSANANRSASATKSFGTWENTQLFSAVSQPISSSSDLSFEGSRIV